MDQELTYKLGESVLDLSRGTLHRAGELILLRPKTFKLLRYLAHNAGRVVTKKELLEAIWPRTTVTEDSLTQCIRDARKCIGDEEHTIIRTVSRRGYMHESAPDQQSVEQPLFEAPDDLDLVPTEPKIAVLPFQLATESKAMKPAFDEVVEEITAAISNVRTITVLTRFSTRALARTRPHNMKTALVEAGVDYLVEGEVRGGDPLLNVVITLSDARTEHRLLTQTFLLKAESVLAFHRTVARQVVSALVFNIESAAWQQVPQGATSMHVW